MKEKKTYTEATVDVILLASSDVITTSEGGSLSTGSDNIDKEGWTPVEW